MVISWKCDAGRLSPFQGTCQLQRFSCLAYFGVLQVYGLTSVSQAGPSRHEASSQMAARSAPSKGRPNRATFSLSTCSAERSLGMDARHPDYRRTGRYPRHQNQFRRRSTACAPQYSFSLRKPCEYLDNLETGPRMGLNRTQRQIVGFPTRTARRVGRVGTS